MSEWNAELYAEFLKERNMPITDLLNRIELKNPKEILDLGSGPGNSTEFLKKKYGDSHVWGGDNSESMLAYARKNHPKIPFEYFDGAFDFEKYYCHFDMVFSNACIQWIPDHKKLIDDMMRSIKPQGVLAVQVPYNHDEPVNEIIRTMIESEKWKDKLKKRSFYLFSEGEYYQELIRYSKSVTIWKTTYYHVMKGIDAILHMYESTGLKPYLEQLNDEDKASFEEEFQMRLKNAYPINSDGTVLFPFPRLFFIAVKKDKVVKNKFIPKADIDMMVMDKYEHHMGG